MLYVRVEPTSHANIASKERKVILVALFLCIFIFIFFVLLLRYTWVRDVQCVSCVAI